MTSARKQITALLVMFAMVHACNALYMTFMPLFLDDMAFDAAQRGLLLSIGPFVSMLTQTMWGGVADRAVNKVRVMYALSIGLVFVAGLFLLGSSNMVDPYLPPFMRKYRAAILITAALMLYAFFKNPMMPLIDTISLEYIYANRPSVTYGVIRTMGTASVVVVAYVVGLIVDASAAGTRTIFYVYFGVLIVLLASLTFVPPVAGSQLGRDKTPTLALFRDKWFTVMIIVAFIVSVSYGFNSSNFSNYMRNELGASERVIGINTALGSTLEIFLFIIIHKITKKTGIINLILLCVLAAALRWLATAFVTSIPMLIVIQFFTQPFTWAILIYAIAVYIQKAVPEQLHARGQAVMNMIMSSAGRIVGSLAGGYWLGAWGSGSEPAIYLWMSVFCFAALFGAIAAFTHFGWRIYREPAELKLDQNTVI